MDAIPYSVGSNKDLTIIQTTYDEDSGNSNLGSYISPNGEIIIRRLPADSAKGPHFTFDVRTSDPALVVLQTWDEQLRQLTVSSPKASHLKLPGPHCISIEITAWVPENTELNNLWVQSVSLDLRVLNDVKINVSDAVGLTSISGSVHLPNFPKSKPSFQKPNYSLETRRITVETTSGSIDGLFPLYDLLSLQSISGTIRVGVIPHNIDPTRPAAAELKIKTTSGSISCHLPALSIGEKKYTPPIRDYVTHVESTSGTIYGSYYQGSEGYFNSMSGSIHGSLLPIIGTDHGSVSTLNTVTTSGTTSIELLSPIFYNPESFRIRDPKRSPYIPINDDDPYLLFPPKTEVRLPTEGITTIVETPSVWESLKSSHQSTSGKISVRYPLEWEGTVDVTGITSSMSVSGEKLRIIRATNQWGKKEIVAAKGYQGEGKASMAKLNSISGSLSFSI